MNGTKATPKVRVPIQLCPKCGATLSGATSADAGRAIRPKPGDVTVCMYCAQLLMFGEGLSLVALDALPDHADAESRAAVRLLQDTARRLKWKADSSGAV
jgi:hypothetical protein